MSALSSSVGLLDFAALFPEFSAPSWAAWRAVLARIVAGATREFWAVAGRGSGKSRMVALIAAWAASREYRRAPGEYVYVGVFAPNRRQAAVTFRYIVGLLRSVPSLDALIESEKEESVILKHGVVIEVITASTAAPRSRSYALAIVEEAAFLPTDESANPDVELLRSIRPALGRVPGSVLAVIGSPYARRGVMWQAAQKYAGMDETPGVVFVQADTATLNPTFDPAAIATAYEEDPIGAATEYGAAFRSDVESYASLEAIDAATVPGRLELPPVSGVAYAAFADPAGGGGKDSFTAAVSHAERRGAALVLVLDAVREFRPPFSPESAVAELSAWLSTYGVNRVTGDRYAGEWPPEQFRKRGVEYAASERAKSEIYRDLLPLLNSGRVELLDVPRLSAQLSGLERRTSRGGRDSIDHAPGAHDDVANAVAGALLAAVAGPDFEGLTIATDLPHARVRYGPSSAPLVAEPMETEAVVLANGVEVDAPEDDEDGFGVDGLCFSASRRHKVGW